MATLRMSDLKRVTLTIYVPPVVRFRVWLGMRLIIWGCKLAGLTYKREIAA